MPGARISFTCDTGEDAEIILWLDSFGVRERGFAVKAAIRDYIDRERGMPIESDTDRLVQIEESVADVLRELTEIRKQGLAISINNDIINKDLSKSEGAVDPAVESNIKKLIQD